MTKDYVNLEIYLSIDCQQSNVTQQTRGIHPMLFQCWASVEDGGPTLKQHWVNAPCLLGRDCPVSIYIMNV